MIGKDQMIIKVASELELSDKSEDVALRLYNSGKRPSFSTGICDSLTCGYGNLCENGYWEFPLYPAEKYYHECGAKEK